MEEERTSPSDELNLVFTGLVKEFIAKVTTAGEVENVPLVYPEKIKMLPSHTDLPKPREKYPIFERTDNFLYAYTHAFRNEELCAPIGEYGPEWAERLIVAASSLITASREDGRRNVKIEAGTVAKRHRSLLFWHTARQQETLDTLTDAIQSTLFVAGFLTAYKVPGFEDNPEGLLQEVAERGLFSMLSRYIPPAITAESGRSGWIFTNPTLLRQNQGLVINRKILMHFLDTRDTTYQYHSTGAIRRLDKSGCPVGHVLPGEEDTGVDMMAKLFAQTVIAQKHSFTSQL